MKLTLIAVLLVSSAPLPAKPKTETYPTNCDRVWVAVKRVTAPPHYNFAQLDDTQKKGIVSMGNTLSGKRYIDITLTGTPNACTVAVGGNFSGLIHNDKGDLFKRIQEVLVQPSEQVSETKK